MTAAAAAPSAQDIERLLAHLNGGDLPAAGRLASELTRNFPGHALGWKALGEVARRSARLEDALAALREARGLAPGDASTHAMLGEVLQALERFAEAAASFRDAIRLKPDQAVAWCNLGATLEALGRAAEAEGAYRTAIALAPDLAAAHFNLGVVLKGLARPEEAAASYAAAIRLAPGFAEAHFNLGNVCRALGRPADAESAYREALRLAPGHEGARVNLGNALRDLRRLGEAEAEYRHAIGLAPGSADAHANLGVVLYHLGRFGEAEAAYREAIRLKPERAEGHADLGVLLADFGRFGEAESRIREAIRLAPGSAKLHGALLFTLNYHPDRTASEIAAAYAEFDRRFGAPHAAARRPHANAPSAGRRLRVGYVSPDFRRHSSRHFLEPLLANHDRAAFELFAYAELGAEDDATRRYKTYFERWTPTAGMDDDDAMAGRVRADAIDVLVDLAGHTDGNRLGVFARKPAPVSLSWLGYACTTGLRAIDYLLTDAASAPPGSEEHFAEKPWRLETPAYVYRPAEGMGAPGDLPALRNGFVTFGTLTRAVRINERTIAVWAEILARVPGSRLKIDSFSFAEPGPDAALAARFEARGIARERLDIGFHSPPWDALRGIDIGFDCFPHNSGVTSFETLYMGVPFVTLAGRPSVGLIGSSILAGAGHPEWIARTPDDYVRIATALASDPPALAEIRGRLRAGMSARPIMDERGFAARVEAAYRDMFAIWERGI